MYLRKKRVSQQGRNFRFQNRDQKKNERNFGGETHNYYFRFLPTQIGHIQFLHLEDKREKP